LAGRRGSPATNVFTRTSISASALFNRVEDLQIGIDTTRRLGGFSRQEPDFDD